jgi:hypothetical protein
MERDVFKLEGELKAEKNIVRQAEIGELLWPDFVKHLKDHNGKMRVKKCKECDSVKCIFLFGEIRTSKDGFNDRCKDCCNEKARRFRREKSEKAKALKVAV